MKNTMIAAACLLTSLACSSTRAASFDLSPRMTSERAAAAKSFGAALDNTTWTADCGKGPFKFSFNSNGTVALNDTWNGFPWTVTDARSISMTTNDGGRAYFIFDNDVKSVQFISWSNEACTGKKT